MPRPFRRTGALVLTLTLTAGLALVAVPARAASGALAVTGLRTGALDSAVGIDTPAPTLTWRTTGTGTAAAQTAYEVAAASSPGRLAHPDLWDSGKTTAPGGRATYGGAALTSRERVWWRVRVWDAHGAPSAWSAPATWEMGLLAKSDWSAKWIGDDRWLNRAPTPVTVKLPAADARYVRLDVTKLGLPLTEGGTAVSRLQLAEVAVADSAHPDTDLAKGAAVTASEKGDYPGKWEPEYVTDGSLTTQQPPYGYTSPSYKSQDPGHDVTLTLDLGAATHFDRVVLYPRTDVTTSDGTTPNFPVDYTVKTATDPDAYTTAATVTGQEPPPAYLSDTPPLPLLAKQFDLAGGVRSARLYITALGLYDATVNGRPVSDAVLEPPNTDYRKRAVYSTYDVTKLLRGGANTIGVRLGNGTYNVTGGGDRYSKYVGAQGPPKLLAQLEITGRDGKRVTVATDVSWRTELGPTTFAQWYGGEDDDARREPTGWDRPGADLSTWHPAAVAPDPGIALTARSAPPVVPVGTRKTVKVTQPKPGTYVFDLGENVAGWPVLNVSGKSGTTVTMRPGERLGADGLVDQGTMIAGGNRTPPIYDRYTLSGHGKETWHPRFVYHGLRYLQVTGLPGTPGKGTVSATVLRAGNDSAGAFTSSDKLLDGIHTIIDRSVQGNMFSVLTDCPDREKLGWLEETHLVQPAVTGGYDVEAYYRSLFANMADAQTADGLVPDIAPEYAVFSGGTRDDPNWGSAIILAAWQHYRTYGDTQPLSAYYPNMRRYLDHLTSKASGNLLDYGLGDWAATDQSTPVGIAATYGYYRSASALADIAGVLGRTDDAAAYRKLAGNIASAFNAKYASGDTYGTGSQAGDAFALDMGVVPQDKRAAVLAHLVAAITAKSGHLTVGEIALPAVFRVLSAAGRDDVIDRIATRVTAPSYGYQVVHGATALTEYWDGPTGYGSQDHFMLGAIDSWFTSGLAGIRQADDSVAYGKLVIAPSAVGNLTHASASYRTPRGTVASAWRRTGRTLRLQVTVPAGAPARVEVPLLGGTARPAAPRGATWVGLRDGKGVFTVPAGTWTFTATTPKPVAAAADQVAIEPPFGTDVPVVDGRTAAHPFRVTNLEDHAVTVRPHATTSAGFAAAAPGGAVRVPAHGSATIPVTVTRTGAATGGTVTLTAPGTDDGGGASAPVKTTANLVRDAAMSASSTHSGSDAAWANDGGTDSSVWLNGVGGWNDDTSKQFPDTLTATWATPVTIGRVKLFTLDSAKYPAAKVGLRDFDIQVRDGDGWRTVSTVTGNTAGTVERTFPAATTGALRVVVHDTNDHASSRVIELEGYGS
ncbi:MAG TPA: family 78 glycoside hydrolase catalytic domain [Streptosporangiaceae bacterium]|jgi:alpha-L-rhamnosidase